MKWKYSIPNYLATAVKLAIPLAIMGFLAAEPLAAFLDMHSLRALTIAGHPAVLEPNGLERDDGKRPDGMSLLPWKKARPLVWDATCVDTLAPSYPPSTAGCAGAATATAKSLKRRKYSNLVGNYDFQPFEVETLGSWGLSARALYRELAKRLIDTSRDQTAGVFLVQRISIAIQRGNAVSLLGTLPIDIDAEEFYDA